MAALTTLHVKHTKWAGERGRRGKKAQLHVVKVEGRKKEGNGELRWQSGWESV